jgi:hypothetical protein
MLFLRFARVQTNPAAPVQQGLACPRRDDHVFVLLSDRLIEYDAGDRKITVVRKASEFAWAVL